MIKNIISKLTFDDIADNTNLPVTYKDNNKYSSLIWNTYSTAKITHSNNVNVLNITSVNIRVASNTFTTDKQFRINDFELDINISFNTLNSNNNFFGITSSGSNWIYFNVRNTFIGGLSIVSSANKSMQFNYKFESNKDYNIIVSSIDNKYRLIINGETIGFIDSSIFISSLPANSNVMSVLGSGNNLTSQTDNMSNGKIWNVNISYGAGVKNEDSTHLTKYGSNLLSRLNFDNIQQATSVNIFTPSLESLINSKVNWEYDNSKLTDYYVNTTFKTNISTDFTLLLKMSNNRKNIDTKLIEYGNYKVIYNYIGVPEPEVIVTDKTTSALDFEDGIIDQVSTTIWQKEGTADVTSVNKIFGGTSFETKALGDSLYTNSNVITGGSTPFTIEFYCLLIELPSNIWNFLYSKNNNNDNSDYGIFIKNNILSFVESATAKYANKKIYVNDINKYSITYDGVALRIFVNDGLELVIGTPNGFVAYTQPLRFLDYKIPSLTQYNSTTKGIIDNINIYDGIATKVRDPDPYEEFLVVDLAFDGENNSTKIVDNAYNSNDNDIYDHNVVSYLHFNDNIYDERGKQWSINGSISFSDNSVVGDKSLLITEQKSYLSTPANADFYLDGDFTIEFFSEIKLETLNVEQVWLASNTNSWQIGVAYIAFTNTRFYIGDYYSSTDTQVAPLSGYHHYCWSRKNGVIYTFRDGILLGTTSINRVFDFSNNGTIIGDCGWNKATGSTNFKGYIDELKITKGVGRYTSNFIPQTKEFKLKNKWLVNGNAKISTDQKFDGFSSLYVGGYITTTCKLDLQRNFTISFDYIRKNVLASAILDYRSSSGAFDGFLLTHPSANINKMNLYFNGNGTDWQVNLRTNSDIEVDKKYKIYIVCSNNTVSIYINNVLDITQSYNDDVILSVASSRLLSIGRNVLGGGGNLSAYIKNFKIYKGVAVIPEDPTGKIQLDFDNNLVDKYGNSTWTNNGVTFDQVNSVKGHAAYFDTNTDYIETSSSSLNFEDKNFKIDFDFKPNSFYSSGELLSGNTTSNSTNTSRFFIYCNDAGLGLGIYANNETITTGNIKIYNGIWYNSEYFRIGNNIFTKRNNALIECRNINFNLNLNNASFRLGKPSDSFGSNNGINGYLDNFKTYKEDLLTNNDITIFTDPAVTVNYKILDECIYVTGSGATSSSNGTSIIRLNDSPSLKNFTAEIELYFDATNIYMYGGLIFRTIEYKIRTPQMGYLIYFTVTGGKTHLRFGKGSNSSSDLWTQIHTVDVDSYRNNTYRTLKVIAKDNNFKAYIDNILIFDVIDDSYNISSQFGMNSFNYFNTAMYSKTKRVDIWDENGNNVYYKNWESKIDYVVDRPAVHLPLETNAINTGFSNLTINSVGNPTYHIVDGKKCIKFERDVGMYLSITNNNIFNLGSNSDFYIEFDMYKEDELGNINISNNVSSSSNLVAIICQSNGFTDNTGLNRAGKCYLYVNGESIIVSDDMLLIKSWNNIILKRTGNIITLILNGQPKSISYNNKLDFSLDGSLNFCKGSWYKTSNYGDGNGYISNFKMFVGTSEIPETYNDKKVLDMDFKPTGKSYLFKDNNNKCVIHPVNITQRDYQNSQYCCTFNGTNQYLQLGKNDLFNFGKDDFIIEIKFTVDSFHSSISKMLLSSGETNGVVGRGLISIEATSASATRPKSLQILTTNSSGSSIGLGSSNDVLLNELNHAIIIRNGSNLTINLNDVITTRNDFNEILNFNLNNNTYIGWRNYSGSIFLNGSIYSFKVLRNTTDLSLLEDELDVFNESFKLTNGDETLDQVITNDKKVESHDVRFIKDEESTKLIVDGEFVEVPNVENTTDELILFDNYNSKVKDVKLYDKSFIDEDIFLGNDPIDTEFGEVEYADDEMELFLPEGEFNLIGFIEGYTDRKFSIYNTFYKYELYEGIEYYNITGLDEYSLDEYEIFDLVSGEKYKVLTHEMIKGFISGTVNLKNCGVTSNNMEVFCYRSDNYRHIGTYSVDKDGKYIIPNLDVNSRYDIIFRDKTRKIKDQISNYRQPMKY